jgi:hypothetical protein
MNNKWFFGWDNIKWFISEIGKMYSSKKSYFAKKRVESGIAFGIAQWGMIYFLVENHAKLTSSDIAIWAGVEFAICGYMINQIQKEKGANKSDDSSDEQINS